MDPASEPPAASRDGAADEAQDKETAAPMSLEEIEECNIFEAAKDKFKSRLLQRSLVRLKANGPEAAELIFTKCEPRLLELVKDQHGNYLLQKLLEVSNAEQFDRLFNLLKDPLKELAEDTHGTRAVQKVVEQCVERGRVAELLQALPISVVETFARSITGFHVVVKLLEVLPGKEVEELLDNLCGDPEKVASLGKDQWGCCVLKKCVDRAENDTRQKIVDAITDNANSLVQDPFGNYVVQHLILMRPNPNVGRIIDSLKGSMFELCLQKFSSNVLEKCLVNSADKDRNKIINEILNPPSRQPSEAVRMLLFHQFGNYVFQQALEVAKEPQFSLLIEHSKSHVQAILNQTLTVEGPEKKTLTAEHAQRLAMKLVKKYPPLSEGMGLSLGDTSMGHSMNFDAMGYGQYFDMSQGSGFDDFGYGTGVWPGDPSFAQFPGMWDPSLGFAPPVAFPDKLPGKGKGGRGRGAKARGNGKERGAKGRGDGGSNWAASEDWNASLSQQLNAAAAAGESGAGGKPGQTVRVGRIVGFWPNYTITYDEVPAAVGGATPGGGGGTRRGGRSNNKAKSKAAPKKESA